MLLFDVIFNFFIISQLNFFVFEPTHPPLALSSIISEKSAPIFLDNNLLDVEISAKAAIAVDAQSGKVLYEKNPHQQGSIASITKLMTGLVFLESEPNLSNVVEIKIEDRHFGAAQNIKAGERLTIYDLLHAALVGSDNDAAYALSRVSKYGAKGFVAKMNEKAKSLGMNETNFAEPTGLSSDNVSSPHDIVLLLDEASKNQTLANITQVPKYTYTVSSDKAKDRSITVYATDKLTSSSYLNLITGKTGYLPTAGYCLATKLIGTQDRELYIVVLGSKSIESRFQDVKAIEYFISNKFKF